MSALRPCRTCKHDVAEGAATCPNCGEKNPARRRRPSIGAWVLGGTFAFVLVVGLISSMAGDSTTAAATIREMAYFRDNLPNRIYTFSIPEGTTAEEVRAHAERRQYTAGRIMAAYYYVEGSVIPGSELSNAANIGDANDLIYETPGYGAWRYVFIRPLDATSPRFVDCETAPENGLCR